MPQEPLGKESRSEKVTRALFFLSAVLFHLVLFLAVASYVIFRTPVPTSDPGSVCILPPPPQIEPPEQMLVETKMVDTNSSALIPTIPTTSAQSAKFFVQVPKMGDSPSAGDTIPSAPKTPNSPADPHSPDPRIQALHHTVFEKWHMTMQQVVNRDPSCTFPVYVASYADGDWACNVRLDKDGNIVAGSIPDLVAKINEWSHGAIKGQVVPKPLDIASTDLLDKMPPFIFFTGHKDFILTDAEVENLRKYLNDGGMIWGDNALAGEGSRFDVAFHREMKRVIPDRDKNFAAYSLSDDIFAKGRYPMTQIPAGMNYYAEAPQHLDIGGILAILYTPNDYSDIMFMRINPDDKSFFMTYKPVPPGTLFTNTSFEEKHSIFYRNFNLDTALAVHRLGMNIVSYLLVRFDDELIMSH